MKVPHCRQSGHRPFAHATPWPAPRQGRGLVCLLPLFCLVLMLFARPLLAENSEAPKEVAGQDRPRIALVLSGGGARGAAHLGVLRVLEELQVPVDLVVGTSGGAIIGGLYASGWSPEEIEQWLGDMDWEMALSDRLPRRSLPLRAKEWDERFLFDLEVNWNEGVLNLPRGLILGRNLSFILEQATLRVADIQDFDEFPIPFRAIATDVETGETVVMSEGRLAKAIRASMSVPGVFAPVAVEDRLLVDGGLVENLPVGSARDWGADLVIAVNVGSPLMEKDALSDIFSLSGQLTSLVLHNNLKRSLEKLGSGDILIEPDLGDITSQDFPRSLEAAAAGERAAWDQRQALSGYSLSDPDYQSFQTSQRRPAQDFGKVKSIKIKGLVRVSEERLKAQIETVTGESLDIARLRDDLARLQRIGDIESADFRLEPNGDGVDLILEIDERPSGPHHIRLGLEMFDDFDGGARYNIRIGHVRPSVNALGAEWRSELQMGHKRAVRSEFYQPVDAGERYFLSGLFSHEASVEPVYEMESRRGDVSLRETRVGVDLGLRFGGHGEARLGAWRARNTSETRVGDFAPTGPSRYLSGPRLLLRYDRLDYAEWPSFGQRFEGLLERADRRWGSDRDFQRQMVQIAQVWGGEKDRLLLSGEYAQGDRPLSFQQQFELGGPFSVSGYRQGEFRNDRVMAMRAVWYRQLGAPELGARAGALYAGAGVSTGGSWAHGEGKDLSDLAYGGKVFVGAATPLGPLIFGAAQSDHGQRNVFLTLGLPIHRPRPVSWPW